MPTDLPPDYKPKPRGMPGPHPPIRDPKMPGIRWVSGVVFVLGVAISVALLIAAAAGAAGLAMLVTRWSLQQW